MRKIALSLIAAFAGCVLWASDNLDYGTPAADCVVDRTGYALGYSEEHEQAAWVMYRMTREETLTRAAVRTDDFREDPNIVTFSALPSDYSRSGYDRGHPSCTQVFASFPILILVLNRRARARNGRSRACSAATKRSIRTSELPHCVESEISKRCMEHCLKTSKRCIRCCCKNLNNVL